MYAIRSYYEVGKWRSREGIEVRYLYALTGRDVYHCRSKLFGEVCEAGRRACARDDRPEFARFVLRDLRAGGMACDQREGCATKQ